MNKLTVYINSEKVSGWGHDPHDFRRAVQDQLDKTIGHYNPSVVLEDPIEGRLQQGNCECGNHCHVLVLNPASTRDPNDGQPRFLVIARNHPEGACPWGCEDCEVNAG